MPGTSVFVRDAADTLGFTLGKPGPPGPPGPPGSPGPSGGPGAKKSNALDPGSTGTTSATPGTWTQAYAADSNRALTIITNTHATATLSGRFGASGSAAFVLLPGEVWIDNVYQGVLQVSADQASVTYAKAAV